MVFSREIHFAHLCPSIEEIVEQVSQRTGIQVTYIADKWLLVNPHNVEDVFSLYQEDDYTMTLTNDGPPSDLVNATLYTLLQMGGYYSDWNS